MKAKGEMNNNKQTKEDGKIGFQQNIWQYQAV